MRLVTSCDRCGRASCDECGALSAIWRLTGQHPRVLRRRSVDRIQTPSTASFDSAKPPSSEFNVRMEAWLAEHFGQPTIATQLRTRATHGRSFWYDQMLEISRRKSRMRYEGRPVIYNSKSVVITVDGKELSDFSYSYETDTTQHWSVDFDEFAPSWSWKEGSQWKAKKMTEHVGPSLASTPSGADDASSGSGWATRAAKRRQRATHVG